MIRGIGQGREQRDLAQSSQVGELHQPDHAQRCDLSQQQLHEFDPGHHLHGQHEQQQEELRNRTKTEQPTQDFQRGSGGRLVPQSGLHLNFPWLEWTITHKSELLCDGSVGRSGNC